MPRLHDFARAGDAASIRSLPKSVDRDLSDAAGRAALHVAATPAACAALLDTGASALVQDAESGYTPLHRAVLRGHAGIAMLLASRAPAVVAVRDAEHMTPADVADQSDEVVRAKSSGLGAWRDTLYTWGAHAHQLGYATASGHLQLRPRAVVCETMQQAGIVAQDAARHHGAAADARDGRLWTWGVGRGGRLGLGAHDTQTRLLPCLVVALRSERIVGVACGYESTVVCCASGAVWEWGGAAGGWPRRVEGVIRRRHTVRVAAGEAHVAVVTSDGGVYTWGDRNDKGQLGRDAGENPRTPGQVTSLVYRRSDGAAAAAADVSAGGSTTAIVTVDGDVWQWGAGAAPARQVLDVKAAGRELIGGPWTVRVHVPAAARAARGNPHKRVARVSVGTYHVLAVDCAGGLWSWAHADAAEHTDINWSMLGRGSDSLVHTTPRRIQSLVSRGVVVTRANAGKRHSVAVSSDGRIFAFGRDELGVLGLAREPSTPSKTPPLASSASSDAPASVSTPVEVLHVRSVFDCVAAPKHTCAHARLWLPPVLEEGQTASTPAQLLRTARYNAARRAKLAGETPAGGDGTPLAPRKRPHRKSSASSFADLAEDSDTDEDDEGAARASGGADEAGDDHRGDESVAHDPYVTRGYRRDASAERDGQFPRVPSLLHLSQVAMAKSVGVHNVATTIAYAHAYSLTQLLDFCYCFVAHNISALLACAQSRPRDIEALAYFCRYFADGWDWSVARDKSPYDDDYDDGFDEGDAGATATSEASTVPNIGGVLAPGGSVGHGAAGSSAASAAPPAPPLPVKRSRSTSQTWSESLEERLVAGVACLPPTAAACQALLLEAHPVLRRGRALRKRLAAIASLMERSETSPLNAEERVKVQRRDEFKSELCGLAGLLRRVHAFAAAVAARWGSEAVDGDEEVGALISLASTTRDGAVALLDLAAGRVSARRITAAAPHAKAANGRAAAGERDDGAAGPSPPKATPPLQQRPSTTVRRTTSDPGRAANTNAASPSRRQRQPRRSEPSTPPKTPDARSASRSPSPHVKSPWKSPASGPSPAFGEAMASLSLTPSLKDVLAEQEAAAMQRRSAGSLSSRNRSRSHSGDAIGRSAGGGSSGRSKQSKKEKQKAVSLADFLTPPKAATRVPRSGATPAWGSSPSPSPGASATASPASSVTQGIAPAPRAIAKPVTLRDIIAREDADRKRREELQEAARAAERALAEARAPRPKWSAEGGGDSAAHRGGGLSEIMRQQQEEERRRTTSAAESIKPLGAWGTAAAESRHNSWGLLNRTPTTSLSAIQAAEREAADAALAAQLARELDSETGPPLAGGRGERARRQSGGGGGRGSSGRGGGKAAGGGRGAGGSARGDHRPKRGGHAATAAATAGHERHPRGRGRGRGDRRRSSGGGTHRGGAARGRGGRGRGVRGGRAPQTASA